MDRGSSKDVFVGAVTNVTSGIETVESSKYLLEFMHTKDCAAWTLELAFGPEPQNSFFAANMLYMKCKKHFKQLDVNEKSQILQFLIQNIATRRFSKATLERLCLCICALSCHVDNGVKSLVEGSLSMLINRTSATGSDIASWTILLSSLPDEVSTSNLANSSIAKLNSILALYSHQVLDTMINLAMNRDYDLFDISCKGIISWLSTFPSFESLNPIFLKLLEFLSVNINSQVNFNVLRSCKIIEALFSKVPNDESDLSVQNYTSFLQRYISLWDCCLKSHLIVSPSSDSSSVELVHAIASSVISMMNFSIEAICCRELYVVELFTVLLTCLSCPYRQINAMTFDILEQIADFELEDRHEFLQQEIFTRLITSFLNLCILPVDEEVDEYEDILDFREPYRGIRDLITTSCDHLLTNRIFSQIITSTIKSIDLTALSGPNAAYEISKLESIVFVFGASMSSVKSFLDRCSRDGNNIDSGTELLSLISQLMVFLNTSKSCLASSPRILCTACQWIYPIIGLFNGNKFPPLLQCLGACIEFLRFSLHYECSAFESSKCLYMATIHLTAVIPVVSTVGSDISSAWLLNLFCDYILQSNQGVCPPIECSLQLTNGIFNIIKLFDDNVVGQVLNRFASFIWTTMSSNWTTSLPLKMHPLGYILDIMRSFTQNCSSLPTIPTDFNLFISQVFTHFIDKFSAIYSSSKQLIPKLFSFFSNVITHFGDPCNENFNKLFPLFNVVFSTKDAICNESLDSFAALIEFYGMRSSSMSSSLDFSTLPGLLSVAIKTISTSPDLCGPDADFDTESGSKHILASLFACISTSSLRLPSIINASITESALSLILSALSTKQQDRKVLRNGTALLRTLASLSPDVILIMFPKYFQILSSLILVCLDDDEATRVYCVPGTVQTIVDIVHRFGDARDVIGINIEDHQKLLITAVSTILASAYTSLDANSYTSETGNRFISTQTNVGPATLYIANIFVNTLFQKPDNVFRLFIQDVIDFFFGECQITKFGDYSP